MLQNIKKRTEGFTIIEVLIVLAIAGLIMLIVFLAVPALQRSSRNRGREADASLVASAVNACLTNNNGDATKCGSLGAANVSVDGSKLAQLTTNPAVGTTGSISQANWSFKQKCNGALSAASANDRDFTVTFKVEQGGSAGSDVAPRCISS